MLTGHMQIHDIGMQLDENGAKAARDLIVSHLARVNALPTEVQDELRKGQLVCQFIINSDAPIEWHDLSDKSEGR